jgi:hypothetical protein
MPHAPSQRRHCGAFLNSKAQLIGLPGKVTPTIRSITFECSSTGLRDPDAADSLPARLNLALCCCKSGANQAHYVWRGMPLAEMAGHRRGGIGSQSGAIDAAARAAMRPPSSAFRHKEFVPAVG